TSSFIKSRVDVDCDCESSVDAIKGQVLVLSCQYAIHENCVEEDIENRIATSDILNMGSAAKEMTIFHIVEWS
ncbi:hypothetical protein PFISCL1PPCAC_5353, partial [Pristionchus fissidentatus]